MGEGFPTDRGAFSSLRREMRRGLGKRVAAVLAWKTEGLPAVGDSREHGELGSWVPTRRPQPLTWAP